MLLRVSLANFPNRRRDQLSRQAGSNRFPEKAYCVTMGLAETNSVGTTRTSDGSKQVRLTGRPVSRQAAHNVKQSNLAAQGSHAAEFNVGILIGHGILEDGREC